MWNRANLKANAKVAFKRNYWKCVLVAIILGIVTGAGSSGGSAASSYNETKDIISGDYYVDEYLQDEYFEDEYFEDEYFEDEYIEDDTIASGLLEMFSVPVITILVLIGLVLAFALQFFLFGPVEVGCCNFFKTNAYEQAELGKLTLAFDKANYWKMAFTMFLRNLYTALWTLLLIIPGLIKSYEYRMIPYILTDCPDISRKDAFRISKEMMMGHKWNAFILDLSFFGWALVAAITCGVAGIFYVKPYIAATDAELFIAIREEYFKGQREGSDENNNNNSW